MLDEKKKKAILHRVDHTLLNPNAVTEALNKVCAEAVLYQTATVCVMPAAVAYVKENFPQLTVCTVVGFPLGYQTTAVKRFETADALQNGAAEIDLVINRMDVKNGDFAAVTKEIAAVKEVCGPRVLKVIVEVCDLTQEEKIRLCQCVTEAKADYIKTSTGFGKGGATLEDVALFRKYIGKNVKIKAAGGLRTAAELEAFYDAGVDRIGASCGVEVLK
ncbi:MAG TPA: deoxyribose-phosphate aldolase [Clostridiales bacterium]|nr:deoxyribose-phosphate aldolase [Clostridiales bacterium]